MTNWSTRYVTSPDMKDAFLSAFEKIKCVKPGHTVFLDADEFDAWNEARPIIAESARYDERDAIDTHETEMRLKCLQEASKYIGSVGGDEPLPLAKQFYAWVRGGS